MRINNSGALLFKKKSQPRQVLNQMAPRKTGVKTRNPSACAARKKITVFGSHKCDAMSQRFKPVEFSKHAVLLSAPTE